MSSPSLRTILRSAVFQITVVSSVVFVLVSLALLWGWSAYMLSQINQDERARVTEVMNYLEDLYYNQGEEAVIDAIKFDDRRLWEQEDIFPILERGDQVITFRDPNYEPIAGYPGLWGTDGWTDEKLEHDVIDDLLINYGTSLRGGYFLRVARFYPQERWDIEGLRVLGAVALIIIGLPLSLVTGFYISRKVLRRIEPISETAQAVGAGAVDTRAPLSNSNDEFDMLSIGINRMLDRVESLNRNIKSVSVGVAHDLKTPLANIRGRLELIDRDADDPAAVKEHVDAAENHLTGLLRIFDAILRLGEVEAGQRKSAFRKVDLTELTKTLGDSYAAVFEDRDKTLITDIGRDIHVEGDQELLAQMISNLLDNGVEHARDGATVRLTLRADKTTVTLEVSDNGPGIAPHHADQVFERFYRGDASRSTPGNGLGLSLVKAISDLHDATIELLSDTDGASFEITLPRAT